MGQKNQKQIAKDSSRGVNTPKYNRLKWLFILLLFIGGVIANTYYGDVAWALRAAAGIAVLLLMLGVAFQTTKGQLAWAFVKSARVEMRKVVWPTRQETVQTMLVVVAMVVVAALILWGLDTLFFWLVGWLTGQRG